jgi:hypothetical protein
MRSLTKSDTSFQVLAMLETVSTVSLTSNL